MKDIWRPEDLIDRLSAFIPHGATVLDVGAGSGIVTMLLRDARTDLSITPCDFSPVAVEHLKACGFHDAFVADAHWLPEGKYDVVIATEMLEHVQFPSLVIKRMSENCTDMVIVSVPNKNAIDSHEHVWSFDKSDLIDLFSSVFFSVQIDTAREERHLVVCGSKRRPE